MSKEPIRVTLVIGSLGAGGAERNLLRLGEALHERGYRVSLMTLNPDIDDFYAVPPGIERVSPLTDVQISPRWFDVSAQRRQRRALRRSLLSSAPDLVISFIDSCNVRVIAALHGTGVPVLVSERIDWRVNPLNWRWRLLRWFWYPRARRVVSLARAPVETALHYWPRWPCVHIPNPVPAIPGMQARRLAQFGPNNLVAMGRLVEQKGFDLLIEAFAQCSGAHPNWHLTILGEGPLRASLEDQVRQRGLDERIHLPGNVSPPFPVLAAADLFAFSSRFEAFGMALAEAMACGLPVVSFDCPSGPADVVRDGVDGVLVPAQDTAALAAAMHRLMDDAPLRQALARRAPEVCERFSPSRVFDQWQALVAEVLAEQPEKGRSQ